MSKKSLPLWLSLFLLPWHLCGQTSVKDTIVKENYHLDSVVVTGTGTLHKIHNAPVQTEVISSRTLNSYQGKSLEEILSAISPSFDFNQTDMGAGLQMNGLSSGYVLILLNGRRLPQTMGGQVDLNKISPSSIERIEIVKGAASSLYGSDAIAGVINIITKRVTHPFKLENTTRYGSYNDLRQFDKIVLNSKRWSSETSFTLKRSDGWKNTDKELYRNVVYDNSVTKTANKFLDWSISQRIGFIANENLNLHLEAQFYKKDIYRPMGNPQYSTFNMAYVSQSYNMGGRYELGRKNYLLFDVNYNWDEYLHKYKAQTHEEYVDSQGSIYHPVFYAGDHERQTLQQSMIANLKGVFNIHNHQITTGVEYNQDFLKAPHRLQGDKIQDTYSFALFTQDEWNVTKGFNVTYGFRVIEHEHFGFRFSPKVSLLYKVMPGLNWRATYASGFKTPTLKELYYRYEKTMMSKLVLYLGDKNLKPQLSDYLSTAIDYKQGDFTMSLNLFYNKIRQMIALVEIPTEAYDHVNEIDRTMMYKNLENAHSSGLEINVDYNFLKYFSIGGGYSYNDASGNLLNADNKIEHIRIDGSAFHHATLRATWNKDITKTYTIKASIFGRIQSKRFYKSYGDAPGYNLWRLNTGHAFKLSTQNKLELNVGVDNIFDFKDTRPYGYNYGTKTPGRTYYLSLKYEFRH
ncbi:TonB-dependent receptor [Porphyromonas pogonae]|uniref:TonB-dependent receptor plug domain-containing protein n=1 Tax=Porphyromonas pogonae TaxID=867595 RepID=UPI002E761F29|nr:TonB-dependent receptor [Porphyromonas pogonae]